MSTSGDPGAALALLVEGSPGAAQVTADHLARAAHAFDHLSLGLRRARDRSSEIWQGTASDSFRHRLDRTRAAVDLAYEAARGASRALSTFSSDLSRAKDSMSAARETALASGLRVDGDAISPPTPAAAVGPGGEAASRAWERVRALHGRGRQLEREAHDRLRASLGSLWPLTTSELLAGILSGESAPTTMEVHRGFGFSSLTLPSDEHFPSWFAALTPAMRQAYLSRLAATMDFTRFNPLRSITPGPMPDWARDWQCVPPLPPQDQALPLYPTEQGRHGYVGGGTIPGPGGVEWPIVMPYLEKDGLMYMTDIGRPRDDGGIMQLDGKDPGWQTVASFRGVDRFQEVSRGVSVAGAVAGLTGNRVAPHTIQLSEDGHAKLASTGRPPPLPVQGPGLAADARLADGTPLAPAGAERMKRITARSDALGIFVRAGDTWNSVESHEDRAVFVDYQINDDGRTRAIVHTYQASTNGDGTPLIGSFANTYPEEGTSREVMYSARLTGEMVSETPTVLDSTRLSLEPHDVRRDVDLWKDLSVR